MTGLIVKLATCPRTARCSAARMLVFMYLALALNGCDKTEATKREQATDSPPTSFADDFTATQIFSNMLRKYRGADQYSDQAVLYMSYRLNGRAIQEPQPWAVALDSNGRFAADLFNSQIRCQGNLFSCYVYDIASGNLDNQRLLLPVKDTLPISQLYEDAIGRHFVAGFSEMPLDEGKSSSQPQLVPPTIGLLTGQMEPAWLRADAKIERYQDSEIDGRLCFVLRCWQTSAVQDFVDLWIDKENSTIWQAALPIDCLDKKVRTSPEIENLRIVARFHEAVFNEPIEAEKFALKPRSDATPVSKFVKIPEPLNSEMIGMKPDEFKFETQSGKQLTSSDFQGRTTTLMWIGRDPAEAIVKLDELKKTLPATHNFGVIYSDRDLADPSLESNAMNMQLNEIARNTNVSFYYDKEMAASLAMQIKSVPCIIVLDKNLTIQYATTIEEQDWPTAVKAAIERTDAGEQVGNEMLANYQQFLEAYHQQLLAVSAVNLSGHKASAILPQNESASSGRLRWTPRWTNSQFKLAGNIIHVSTAGTKRLFVFDGWRTVVEMNLDGRIINSYELDLPENAGVSAFRIPQTDESTKNFAVFMPRRNKVFVFDEQWQPKSIYEAAPAAAIQDVRFAGDNRVLVSFENESAFIIFDAVSGEIRNFDDGTANSGIGGYALKNSSLFNSNSGNRVSSLADWQLRRLALSKSGSACCVGTSKDGNWFALGVDDHKLAWSASIGPQTFDNMIEPVSSTDEKDPIWAVANSDGVVHIFDNQGTWIGDFRSDAQLLGLTIVNANNQLRLVVSTQKGVDCWNLDIAKNSAKAVSHGN